MVLPGDAGHKQGHAEVDGHPDHHGNDVNPQTAVDHQDGGKEPEERARGPDGRGAPSIGRQDRIDHQPQVSAQPADQIEGQKTPVPYQVFQHRPHNPEGDHVEEDVRDIGGVQKYIGHEHPRLMNSCDRHESPIAQQKPLVAKRSQQVQGHLDDPGHYADQGDGYGHHRSMVTPVPPDPAQRPPTVPSACETGAHAIDHEPYLT